MEYVASREIPPVVYVPISGVESEGRAQIELRRLQTGQLAIAAFSALDRLHGELGSAQPWLLVRIADLERQAANRDVSRVLLDPRLPRSATSGGAS
ncbi:SAV_915 family protein [Microbacterium sp. WCS2018Hpa-23]|uniref:SAV_915 family protein n=1 Tax=Microbacterium sp. WCS2018Hpa-23 TaxID=3073634 RepID=UPI0028831228|nr:SAV_915 family protein [Microbacterium sp. WCS2018Hpa-23]